MNTNYLDKAHHAREPTTLTNKCENHERVLNLNATETLISDRSQTRIHKDKTELCAKE